MADVELDGRAISDWASFHDHCALVFGFPDFYGRNLNAWIDCLTYVREGDGMSRFVIGPEDMLVIKVVHSESMPPELLQALRDCIAFVNERCEEDNEKAPLELSLL